MQSTHLSALMARHEGLDRSLREELNRPAPDATRVQQLKKLKLQVKEAMTRH